VGLASQQHKAHLRSLASARLVVLFAAWKVRRSAAAYLSSG
jgi:hypothetical protein